MVFVISSLMLSTLWCCLIRKTSFLSDFGVSLKEEMKTWDSSSEESLLKTYFLEFRELSTDYSAREGIKAGKKEVEV